MGKRAKRIGIFGGTFNPIHNGHLIISTAVMEEKHLDEVLFVPCARPPHKGSGELAPGGDRLRMVELAVSSNPRFRASDIELKRGGRSYSVKTIEELRMRFNRGEEFYFIVGADSLHEISTWKDVERLSGLCDFIIAARSGYPLGGLSAESLSVGKEVFRRLATGIVETPVIDISSTEIRDRVGKGKCIDYMVPEAVAEYISRKGLYQKYEKKSDAG